MREWTSPSAAFDVVVIAGRSLAPADARRSPAHVAQRLSSAAAWRGVHPRRGHARPGHAGRVAARVATGPRSSSTPIPPTAPMRDRGCCAARPPAISRMNSAPTCAFSTTGSRSRMRTGSWAASRRLSATATTRLGPSPGRRRTSSRSPFARNRPHRGGQHGRRPRSSGTRIHQALDCGIEENGGCRVQQ